MPKVLIKRGTRAQIDAAAASNQLAEGELYLITDEDRLAVGTSASTYSTVALTSEISSGSATAGSVFPWVKRTDTLHVLGDTDGANLSTISLSGGRLYLQPFSVQRELSISGLGIYITTAATGGAVLGIYDTTVISGSETPGSVIAETPDIDTSVAVFVQGSFANSITLYPGVIYWAALLSKAFISVRKNAVANPCIGRNGVSAQYFQVNTPGQSTLPNPAPSALTFSTNFPAIYVP